MGPVLCAEAGESEGRGEADKNAAEGSGPAAAGHARTLQVTPTTPDSFFSNSGKATPNEDGKTDQNGRGRRQPWASTSGQSFIAAFTPGLAK